MIEPGADFLSLVAARATGAMPLVEPRLPSRFEPETGPSILRAASHEPVEQAIETESPWSAPSLRRAATRPQTHPFPPAPEAGEAPIPPPAAPRPRRSAEPETDARETVFQTIARPSPPRHPQQAERAEPAMLTKALPILAAPMPPRQAPTSEAPQPRLAPAEMIAPAAAPRSAARLPATIEAARTPRHTPVKPEPAQQPPPSILRPLPPPQTARQSRRGERRQPEPVSPPETVVNIVIGRIDVRAQAAPPQAAPAQPRIVAPQPQTLADYLQRREAAR